VRVQTVGVDYLSVGGYFKDGPETHCALLGAGIWIIEGLNLAPVAADEYELICLPVKLIGNEGAEEAATHIAHNFEEWIRLFEEGRSA
jgi:arylformamidase